MGTVNLPIVLVTEFPLHVLESNIRHNQPYRAWTDRRFKYIPFVPPHSISRAYPAQTPHTVRTGRMQCMTAKTENIKQILPSVKENISGRI
jgi:hypothetical protein